MVERVEAAFSPTKPVLVPWDTTPADVGECRWSFPVAHEWASDDLVGGGADLEPATLIHAYKHGMFPMGLGRGKSKVGWWSPNPRGILPLESLRITRSMRQSAKRFEVRFDTNFESVIAACANPNREGSWITRPFIAAYTRLHELGWAHSVETYNAEGRLVGGLYGVRIGCFFAGESMFHTETDASKVALMHLVEAMKMSEMTLLDVQWCTDHLATLGVVNVPRDEYLKLLATSLAKRGSLR